MQDDLETEDQLAEHFLHTMVMVAASIEGDTSQIGRISSATAAIHTRQAVRRKPKKIKRVPFVHPKVRKCSQWSKIQAKMSSNCTAGIELWLQIDVNLRWQ